MNHPGSRWTGSNIVKVIIAFALLPLVAYYLLAIGLVEKNKKATREGGIYAIVFTLGLLTSATPIGPFMSFLGALAAIASGVRTYQMRNLWLPLPRSPLQRGQIPQPPPYSQLGAQSQQAATPPPFYSAPKPQAQPQPVRQPAPQSAHRNYAHPPPPAKAPPPSQPKPEK